MACSFADCAVSIYELGGVLLPPSPDFPVFLVLFLEKLHIVIQFIAYGFMYNCCDLGKAA